MNNTFRIRPSPDSAGTTVSFGDRFQSSEQFDLVFKEGMALVERTAGYLDGAGRRESKGLSSSVTVLYATESMRLTTRLLDIASWLLIRRSLKANEITAEEALRRRQKLKLYSLGRPSHVQGFADLPRGLRALIEQSFALNDRIVRLDRAMTGTEAEAGDHSNPVARQIALLQEAFAVRGGRLN